MNTILTDDERREIAKAADADSSGVASFEYRLIGLTEAAVLAKLREQEPVAHRYRFGNVWMFDTCRWNGQDADEVVPVYLRPMPKHQDHDPCMGKNCGKTCYDQEHSAECIDETAKSQGWHTKPAVVPPGYKLVPVEPTMEMVRAGAGSKYEKRARNVWRDMLAAAPEAPALPAEVREVVKVAREALGKVDTACRLIPEDLEGYLEPLSDALSDARAAIARIDALGGME